MQYVHFLHLESFYFTEIYAIFMEISQKMSLKYMTFSMCNKLQDIIHFSIILHTTTIKKSINVISHIVITFIGCRNHNIKISWLSVVCACALVHEILVDASIIIRYWWYFTILTSQRLKSSKFDGTVETSYISSLYIHIVSARLL